MNYQQVKAMLEEKGQTQLLKFYDQLDESGKAQLLENVQKIDWSMVELANQPKTLNEVAKEITPISGLRVKDIKEKEDYFYAIGEKAIKEGKVGAVLLAGGMGTRLGIDGPKGAFNIGINKTLYIFERQMKNLMEVTDKVGATVPVYVMTSDKNHDQTVAFWKKQNYFGYPESQIKFFKQEMAPAVDFEGKVMLESKTMPALSPNGNGGWYLSLKKAGLKEDLDKRGVEWLNIYAVDNVLQRIADPVFVGATIDAKVNCGAKAVFKNHPREKVGVLCYEDGVPSVIEYYELGEEMANATDEQGNLLYGYGVIMNYLFKVEQLEKSISQSIPVHTVQKKVQTVDEFGNEFKPQTENGIKFEVLAVDLVKYMETVLPYEVVREKEFAPVKNMTGVDSVESARELLKLNGVEL